MSDFAASAGRQDSSNSSEDTQKVRKKRLQGACDYCRKKKAKCDSAEMPGNICTKCIVSKIKCSHDAPRQTKLSDESQIQTLEGRLEKLQEYIRRNHPGEDVDRILKILPDDTQIDDQVEETAANTRSSPQDPQYQPIVSDSAHVRTSVTQDESEISDDDDDLAHVALSDHFATKGMDAHERFFGEASVFMFEKHASTVKNQVVGESDKSPSHRRPDFWKNLPWELSFMTSPETTYVYPPEGLLHSLVSLYFERTNSLIPILHEPTFMRSLLSGQHHSDPSFGMTVLLVCALGSRYSQDSKVTVTNDGSGLSSGWHYFCQVPIYRRITLFDSNICDLQYYALAALYLVGTSVPHMSWILLGIGMRFALEKGAHRSKGNQKPSAAIELQKRAFWAIVCLDRIGSAFVGRPYGYPHESFDIEYPIECDDKYWETDDPEKAFQQPPGVPCSITAFNFFIKLCEILGFTLRTLYANKKSKLSSGFVGIGWAGRMVAELDSSMNSWKDSLPSFLHWDSEREDALFFHQSANLHSIYHYLQIQIHRPFLTRSSSLSSVSFAMCTNAARSISHILEASTTRGLRILPTSMTAAFVAGIFIAIGLKSGPRSHYTSWNPDKDRENLEKCINTLKECEKRWHCAGRLVDMLIEASSAGEYPPRSTTTKRRRQSITAPVSPQAPIPSTGAFTEGMISAEADNTNFLNMDTPGDASDPMNDWDLQQLFLRELGLPQNNFLQNYPLQGQGDGSLFSLANDVNAFTDQILLGASDTTQPSGFPLEGDVFPSALWSDTSSAFTGFKELEAYLANAGQK